MGDGREGGRPGRVEWQRDGGDGLAMEAGAEAEQLLRLRLLVRPAEPISGWVGVADQPTAVAFCGWIEFMAVLSRLRHEHAPSGPDEAVPYGADPHARRARAGRRRA